MMDKLISQQAAIDAIEGYIARIGKLKRRGLTKGEKAISLDMIGTIKTLPSAQIEPEAVSEWKKEFREYVDSLDITRDDWKGIIEYIDELPSAEPDTTTHDSNVVKKGGNDEDRTTDDYISRTRAIDALRKMQTYKLVAGDDMLLIDRAEAQTELMMLPSAQPDIIRCPDCYYNDGTAYCELHFRNVKAKDFCSFAERSKDATD